MSLKLNIDTEDDVTAAFRGITCGNKVSLWGDIWE